MRVQWIKKSSSLVTNEWTDVNEFPTVVKIFAKKFA